MIRRYCLVFFASLVCDVAAQEREIEGVPSLGRMRNHGTMVAQIVASGPAALEPTEEKRRMLYLSGLGERMVKRPEPHAWLLGAVLLQGSAATKTVSGSGVVVTSDHAAGNAKLAGLAIERAHREGRSDPIAMLMMMGQWISPPPDVLRVDLAKMLTDAAPDNRYAWLVRAAILSSEGDKEGMIASLKRAAAAPQYDDYHDDLMRVLLRESQAYPPAELRQVDGTYRARAVERLLVATNIAEQTSGVWSRHLAPMNCWPSHVVVGMESICLDALILVAGADNTFAGRERALTLMRPLLKDESVRRENERELRQIAWQREKLYSVGFAVADAITEADATIADWERGFSEVQVGLARLNRHHISVDPPPDWQPSGPAKVFLQ